MFSKPRTEDGVPTPLPNATDVPSIIASDLRIVGNLIRGGAIEIEGEIEGNVTCASVTVRRSGKVTGDVIADEVQADGQINGLVKGRSITVSETGRITGVIMYESLSIKDGAYIDGQCKSMDKLHKGNVQAIESDEDDDVMEMTSAGKEQEVSYMRKKKKD
jgi:cytoskeletal protein CcmA (bactofilin family)